MFLNFRVANFKSINEMVELSMIPSDLKNSNNITTRANPKALKNNEYFGLTSSVIYGANASGKSNVIRSFYEFRNFVLNSTDNKPNAIIDLHSPFKLNDSNQSKPSFFSIDFILNNVLYTYSIKVFNNEVLNEDLIFFPKGLKVKIFQRNKQNFIKGNGYDGVFETIKLRTNENQLFLSKAASENVEIPKNIYRLFNKWVILTTDVFHNGDFNNFSTNFLIKNEAFQKYFSPIVKSFVRNIDTQVVDFNIYDGKIKTLHLNDLKQKVEFDFEDESSGTQRVLSFVPVVFMALVSGSLIVVDEFERSLHPEIAQYILSLFNDHEVNKRGAQFVFATHDTTLLSPENKLRRDQINLVEKNIKGETELYSLSDVKGIREGNYEKWYLEGRLGGIPNIARETFRHELIDLINS